MDTKTLIAQESGVRVDSFIAERFPEITRSAAVRLIEQGHVTLNGNPIRKNHRVTEGESFSVTFPPIMETELVAEDIPLEVAFEDEHLIVVNKPRGMVVHPAPGHSGGTLVNALMSHCGDSLSGIGGSARPGIVHRIDKMTSGLIIAAKNDAAHLSLSAQLQSRSLSRIYEAVTIGRLREESGTIDAPIGRHRTDRKKMAVTPQGRHAVTHYEVLANYDRNAHVRCRLETGRTHQIRIHMAHIGHPLLGDFVYGPKKSVPALDGQCLHARELKFIHPASGQQVELSSALPEYFAEVLKRL